MPMPVMRLNMKWQCSYLGVFRKVRLMYTISMQKNKMREAGAMLLKDDTSFINPVAVRES